MKKLLFAMILSFSTIMATAQVGAVTTETDSTITITNNGGGNIQKFITERNRLAKSGKVVRLAGYCGSACTIFYSLPNACLMKGSSLHFHGAKVPVPIIDFLAEAIANKRLSSFYRSGIKTNFNNDWKHYTMPMKKVSREDAKKLDKDIKFCENM